MIFRGLCPGIFRVLLSRQLQEHVGPASWVAGGQGPKHVVAALPHVGVLRGQQREEEVEGTALPERVREGSDFGVSAQDGDGVGQVLIRALPARSAVH